MEQNARMGAFVPSSPGDIQVPDLVPVLSRGKHRHPRQGACFMELASFVAGERWSDHPACTHPLLASLARLVNDATSDDARHELAGMIPDVIGLVSDDPRVDIRIALRSATAALPVVSARRQSSMAAGVVAGNRLLARLDEGAGRGAAPGRLEEESQWALAHAPVATRWAEQFADDCPPTVGGFRRFGAPVVVRTAVEGIAHACIPDPDRLLRDLLRATITDCAAWIGAERSAEAGGAPGSPGGAGAAAASRAAGGRLRDRRRRAGLSGR